jgi:hypothetical protein
LKIPTRVYSGVFTGTVSVDSGSDFTYLRFTSSGTYTA